MNKITKFLLSFIIITSSFVSNAIQDNFEPKKINWPFEGVLGKFDRQSIQRGFKVYKDVCSTCHSIKLLSFRNLSDIGYNENEVKAIASAYNVTDGPNEEGQMFERTALPSDSFPSPYTNEQEARASNNGAFPPDLSLIIKARKDGANYLYSLLTGYLNPPEGMQVGEGMYYNPYFPGKQIAMASPLNEGIVEYSDGTQATLDQMSKDLVNFLQWAAEPEMEVRKSIGIKVLIYLLIFTIIFYLAKKRIWSRLNK